MVDGKICDFCSKMKADFICCTCDKDICKKCTRTAEIKMEYKRPTRYSQTSYDIYKMARFNFCNDCISKVPWNSKEPLDEETHGMILDRLKKRILAEEIVKSSGGVK